MRILDQLIVRSLSFLPRNLLWPFARRYIAGIDLNAALNRVQSLHEDGWCATLDVLGEDVAPEDEAEAAAKAYCEVLDALKKRNLNSGISIKLTQLGARQDPQRAETLLKDVLSRARECERFVRIDMEDSIMTTTTIEIYERLATQFSNVGVVLQSYLRRSLEDLERLIPLKPNVRICKGIYREPEEIAFQGREDIRQSFLRLLERLLAGGGQAAIATHDGWLVKESLQRLADIENDETRRTHEFQMLLGVGHSLRPPILERHWRLRIYVPFGHHWHSYALRRLRENPTLGRYVIKNLLTKGERPTGRR